MQEQYNDVALLLELQQNDMELLRIRKLIAELPQRKVIVAVRKKIAQIKEKQARVAHLRADVEDRLASVSVEDAKLAEKQRAEQEFIDNTQGGYRDVEAHAKVMNGYAKRRVTLEVELDKLGAELEKIAALEKQVNAALIETEEQESQAVASFQKEGGALKVREARVSENHDKLAKNLPDDLRKRYEKIADRRGGVAVARLLDQRCGACRLPIEEGHLIEMKSKGNLGECPHCRRILVITDPEL